MWKTDDVSSLTESSCRKTVTLSLLQDDKGRADMKGWRCRSTVSPCAAQIVLAGGFMALLSPKVCSFSVVLHTLVLRDDDSSL